MTTIYSCSIPYNNLVIISLVQIDEQYEKYTTLFTFVPGEISKDKESNRTYNFQRKVVMKIPIRDLPGLSMVLTRSAEGLHNIVLPYSKFTQSNNTSKTMNIFLGSLKSKTNTEAKAIVINISSGDNKFAFNLPLPDAYSLGTIIRTIYDYAMKLDIENFEPKPFQIVKNEDQSLEKSNFTQNPQENINFPF